ncbi:MAG: hypothetical protein G01um101419_204 [Parcubacteria group bacterium Gr01-1014_19]|nr:MAG: hypothetical protein G01um101419_204 [Parcubacteria group bacterium Gr01-1014_19]
MDPRFPSLIISRSAKELALGRFRVEVNFSLSLADMIKRGRYGAVNPKITDRHFPHPLDEKENKRVDSYSALCQLVHINHEVSLRRAMSQLARPGARLSNIWELLAFGIRYPEEQEKFPIVAAGSIFTKKYCGLNNAVPSLWVSHAYGRSLGLGGSSEECRFGASCRFLVTLDSA